MVQTYAGALWPGARGLASYRLYFLNGLGRIVRAVELDCADDDAARVEARARAERERWELWDRARLVESSQTSD